MRKVAAVAAFIVFAIAIYFVVGWWRAIPNSYYSMTTSFVLDGKPLDIRIIVECRVIRRGEFGTSGRYAADRVPYLYGVRTGSGNAVIVQTPYVCGGGYVEKMPADFLPVVLWAEKADDLEFLTAYTSDLGYEHPSSRLKFKSARFARATADEFRAWKKTAPPNIVPADKDPFDTNASAGNFRAIPRGAGEKELRFEPVACKGLFRLPIPDEYRPKVQALRPVGQPKFWTTSGWYENDWGQITGKIALSPAAAFEREKNNFNGSEFGLLRTDGGGTLFSVGQVLGIKAGQFGNERRLPPEALPLNTLPFDLDFSYAHLRSRREDAIRQDWKVTVELLGSPKAGQMYCYRQPDSVQLARDGALKRITIDIGGGTTLVAGAGPDESGNYLFAVIEEDKYLYLPTGISLSNEGGALR